MRMEVWADIVSPWTHVLKRRLDAVLGEDSGVEVVWRPFTVDPTAPAKPLPLVENFLAPPVDEAGLEPFTRAREGLPTAGVQAVIAKAAAEEGIGPRFGALWRVDSEKAQRLVHLAYTDGDASVQNRIVDALLHAHHVAGDDISDPEVLRRVASAEDFAAGPAMLEGGVGKRDYAEQLARGKAMHVEASPTIVHDGEYLVGAVSREELREFVDGLGEPVEIAEERERLRLAESLLRQRDAIGALTLVEPVLAAHPNQHDVVETAARAYYGSAQLNKARRLSQWLVDRNPADFFAHYLLGRTLSRLGLEEEARPHLKLAEAVTPPEED
ncbi:DsbA family protein [Salininema proteolyticum]|uniref:DsbA family protein n=1 Tax=Salininema proteolyticum TaxID=1607685 RepID=A0ABV8U1D3_9ACTN